MFVHGVFPKRRLSSPVCVSWGNVVLMCDACHVDKNSGLTVSSVWKLSRWRTLGFVSRISAACKRSRALYDGKFSNVRPFVMNQP